MCIQHIFGRRFSVLTNLYLHNYSIQITIYVSCSLFNARISTPGYWRYHKKMLIHIASAQADDFLCLRWRPLTFGVTSDGGNCHSSTRTCALARCKHITIAILMRAICIPLLILFSSFHTYFVMLC